MTSLYGESGNIQRTTFYACRPNISSGTAGIRTPSSSPSSSPPSQIIMSGKTEPISSISKPPIRSPRSASVVGQAPEKPICSTLPTPPGSNRPSLEVTKDVGELYSEVVGHRSGHGPRERLVLPVPLDKYEELRKRLEEYPGRLRYNYDYINEKILGLLGTSRILLGLKNLGWTLGW